MNTNIITRSYKTIPVKVTMVKNNSKGIKVTMAKNNSKGVKIRFINKKRITITFVDISVTQSAENLIIITFNDVAITMNDTAIGYSD